MVGGRWGFFSLRLAINGEGQLGMIYGRSIIDAIFTARTGHCDAGRRKANRRSTDHRSGGRAFVVGSAKSRAAIIDPLLL